MAHFPEGRRVPGTILCQRVSVLKCQKNFIFFKGLEGLEEDQHFPLTFLHNLKEVETLLSSNTSAEEDNPTHMSPSYRLNM